MSFLRRHRHLDTEDDTDEDSDIDPELRLRTVRTAASTIAESNRTEARRNRRRKRTIKRKGTTRTFFGRDKRKPDERPESTADVPKPVIEGQRRNIYVNVPLPPSELNQHGEPTARYARNKVRTSKYTVVTFLPKNLSEQFRRIANLYFLSLVLLSIFPIFGAAAPQISMVPLLIILTATAVKDGVEDYRRATIDEEVNGSAATKLGGWRNVNQPSDPRTWFERTFGLGTAPDKVTKGVRRLREKEASESNRIVLTRQSTNDGSPRGVSLDSRADTHIQDPGRAKSLDDIMSVGSDELDRSQSLDYSYPPAQQNRTQTTFASINDPQFPIGSSSQYALSTRSRTSDGVFDWQRQTTGVSHWERTLWKKLEVGDIVLLRENDQVPADIVVLSTSDANGLCYVETKNLDGETNLKPRKSLKATSSILSEEDLEHASFILDSEPPHVNLYNYNGVLKFRAKSSPSNPSASQESLEPVTINELLLRGCAVRNTTWIIGLVVFTGADTKIMLNGGDTPSKRSKIEKETNFNVVMNFLILISLCLIAAIANGFFYAENNTSADFFYEDEAAASSFPAINGLVTFASSLIAFQNIVPISLYISIEVVKTIQAYFISQDIDMYYAPLDTPCVPKTWNISDDLGQIEYIFSDKTGTLTQNIMEFQKCSVQGIAYGEGVTEAMRGAALREGKAQAMTPEEQDDLLKVLKTNMLRTMTRGFKNRYARDDLLTLISPQIAEHLTDRSNPQRDHLIAFFRALAICHTVLADKPEPRDRPFEVNYKAESPDESALVAAARDVGFPFIGRSNNAVDIEVMGQPERYIPLRVLEFNSTRKRMSVIVRNPEGKIVLYCKGADSVIFARLTADHDAGVKASTARDLEAFANGGLRTLLIAYRYMSEEEYLDWSRKYDAAASATKDREEEIEKASELVERDLTILGATALEDKLQEGVPEAIETLHQAGIKLWILTGDKVQTAIEIGFSCNLLKSEMEIMILSADSPEAARSQIEAGLNKIASLTGPPNMNGQPKPRHGGGFAVVIDGDTLRYALESGLKSLFLNLGTQCDTVVCCRVSPAQKALTVKLVKEGRNAMTLSIGDGANDVAMIQEANIGCGLFGLEGSQAAMSADYAFGQFRFLTKLLLVHGRWSYQRIADMHSNFFYKNVIWTFAMFWFLIYNNFDATYLYQVTFILLYNVVFTSLPVGILGAFDQDINAKASMAFPQLYKRGILGLEYTRTKFWLYMFDGLYQSVVVFFIPYAVWTVGTPVSYSGRGIESLADFGTTVSVAAIFSANIFVGLSYRYWNVMAWIVIIGSSLSCLVWIGIYSQFESVDFNGEITLLFSTVDFWASIVLSVALAITPRYIAKSISQIYFPLDKDIIREAWVAGNLKEQLGIRHRYRKNRDPEEPSPFSEADRYDDERGKFIDGTRSPPQGQSLVGHPTSPYQGNMIAAASSSTSSTYPAIIRSPPSPPPSGPTPGTSSTTVFSPSPTSPNPSYYSASGLPPPSPYPDPYTPRSPNMQDTHPPMMSAVSPSALLHDTRGAGSGGEYEMHIRSTLSSPAIGTVDPPQTPQESRITHHDRYSRNTPSGPSTPNPNALVDNSYVVDNDEPPWSAQRDPGGLHPDVGDQRYSDYSDSPRAV